MDEEPVDTVWCSDCGRKVPANEAIRGEDRRGVLTMLSDDLERAWVTYEKLREAGGAAKAVLVRGRVRGLAMALATVRSPLSREQMDRSDWAKEVIVEENEARLRVKAKKLV